MDLEATEWGFRVDDVDSEPGQARELRKGGVIVEIADVPLLGLGEDALEKTFGENFRSGAILLIIDEAELKAATATLGVSEKVEVGGLVMTSMPPRNRRRRKAEEAFDEEEDGNEGAADASASAGAASGSDKGEVGNLMPTEAEERRQFEYMDHTADVILHSWGTNLKEAIAQVCVCFFSYMTDLDRLGLGASVEVEGKGHDILDMLYHLLDEFLFSFGTNFIMCRRVEVLEIDEVNFRVKARGFGEKFDLSKHPQGTEIKAITMHQMKILTPETLTTEEGTMPRKESGMEGGAVKEGFPFECYVLVDI